MPAVSVVIITLNEEANLDRTLNAVKWADEVVVVDSGSTDQTQDIAVRHGAKLIIQPFLGYGLQKRFAVEQARNDWVFVVDADEVVTADLASEIRTLLKSTPAHVGYRVPRDFHFLGREIKFGGERGKTHLRLFDRTKGNYNDAQVHEDVVLTGTIGVLKHKMMHYSYPNLHQYWAKFNEYTTKGALDLQKRGKTVSKAYIMVRFPFSFLQLYLFKGLILDGYPGFIWALFSAMYPVVKYAKLHELNAITGSPKA